MKESVGVVAFARRGPAVRKADVAQRLTSLRRELLERRDASNVPRSNGPSVVVKSFAEMRFAKRAQSDRLFDKRHKEFRARATKAT